MINMIKLLKKFDANMPNQDFINLINRLDSIDNGNLSEQEEDTLSDFYNNLYNICSNQIDYNLTNNTFLPNRGESIGDFMYFLKMIG